MNKIKIYLLLLLSAIFIIDLKCNSYAFTFENLDDFCSNINNTEVTNTNTIALANKIVTNKQRYLQMIEDYGENIDDYNSFFIYNDFSSGQSLLFIYNQNSNLTIDFAYLISGYRYPTVLQNAQNTLCINLDTFTIFKTGGSVYYGRVENVGLMENYDFSYTTDKYFKNQYIYSELLTTTLRGESPYIFAKRL